MLCPQGGGSIFDLSGLSSSAQLTVFSELSLQAFNWSFATEVRELRLLLILLLLLHYSGSEGITLVHSTCSSGGTNTMLWQTVLTSCMVQWQGFWIIIAVTQKDYWPANHWHPCVCKILLVYAILGKVMDRGGAWYYSCTSLVYKLLSRVSLVPPVFL